MEKTANKQKMHGGKIALYVIAILWTVVTLFPVVVTVMASFKTNSERVVIFRDERHARGHTEAAGKRAPRWRGV